MHPRMAAPMRDNALDGGHRAKVADPRTAAVKAADPAASNFEYDDNEWDIGIGDLIIDLDADIEKTNERSGGAAGGGGTMASTTTATKGGKLAVEHSATVDKGLKMKIKRTKPGTKTSEAKHEIVKPGEQNGAVAGGGGGDKGGGGGGGKHPPPVVGNNAGVGSVANNASGGSSKRGSSGHRRDKARDKHGGEKVITKPPPSVPAVPPSVVTTTAPEVNGVVTRTPLPVPPTAVVPVLTQTVQQQQTQQTQQQQTTTQPPPPTPQAQRVVFPVCSGPGPPAPIAPNTPGPPPSPAVVPAPKPEVKPAAPPPALEEARSASPPPAKKLKTATDPKDMLDVCVGTSVGTITEPDCLGPCEPGTSVTLEGIVWHETEGGVLVVNVTWRGKTYVGTLLDCTRHDWAPPRFCDSPTSDLDARLPKGRGKRGRAAASTNPGGDLSNFTETRSSVHSKLRNGGAKGRRGAASGTASPAATMAGTGSPTPFVSPRPEPGNKRKGRPPDEETVAAPASTPGKKSRGPPPAGTGSPPSSPVLLECPEPNCSKKYKHINGLKYHQSHAHGSAEEDEAKDTASTSEAEESNAEASSPATPVKSPEKQPDPPPSKEESPAPPPAPPASNGLPPATPPASLLVPEVLSQPPTPKAIRVPTPTPQLPPAPPPELVSTPAMPVPTVDPKPLVKPGVLRFGQPVEDYSVFCNNKPALPVSTPNSVTPVVAIRTVSVAPSQPLQQQQPLPLQPPPVQQQQQQPPPLQPPPLQPPQITIPQPLPPAQLPLVNKPPPPQFKVKPTAALMPEDKKSKLSGHKKKNRKSPAGSPHPPEPSFEPREDVQSPAYSDISDDAAPVLEAEVDKGKVPDKKGEVQGPAPHNLPHYGMYPFYGQPPYLVPSVEGKPKEPVDKQLDKPDKDKKDGEFQQKLMQQHYYPYGYYPAYNMEPSYPVSLVEDKGKDTKEDKSPSPQEQQHPKPPAPAPPPPKVKPEPCSKDKHQNENHQILKESIEMKSQMSPYVYSRQDDLRRYYLYSDQRRKEPEPPKQIPKQPLPSPGHNKHKEKPPEEKKEEKPKQEGVKPTMETQGPPPPPTSQYAYIHPSYMQSPHYGALPFDPGHPMYRNMLGPYGASPYLHPQLPRYHAPEDLSRPPQGPTKALDLLQHHASQYYSSHKIHELQERALKSPTPKAPAPGVSPGGSQPQGPSTGPSGPPTGPSGPPAAPNKPPGADGKDSRSPPPQRHVHTHHHTHVGLGYPILTGQYPAPYGGKPMVRP